MLLTLLATTRSGASSQLRLPTATEVGRVPVGNVCWGANVPSLLPSRTDTVFAVVFAVTRSSLPSTLKSPVATETGRSPVANVRVPGSSRVPSERASSIWTVSAPAFAT